MADYRMMYERLFNRVTDVIGSMVSELQEIQKESEELYFSTTNSSIHLSDSNDKSEPEDV